MFFCPGNHDLWCTGDGNTARDSLHKLQQLEALCARLGVHTGPRRLAVEAAKGGTGVWIVPMHSWYHLTFDTEPDLPVRAHSLRCDVLETDLL